MKYSCVSMSQKATKYVAMGSRLQHTHSLSCPQAGPIYPTTHTKRQPWTRQHRMHSTNVAPRKHTTKATNVFLLQARHETRSKTTGGPQLRLSQATGHTRASEACELPHSTRRQLLRYDRGKWKPIDSLGHRSITKCSEKWMGATNGDAQILCFY